MDKQGEVLQDDEAPLRVDPYARAGVNIAAGNAAVERYRGLADGWRHPSQLGTLGGFSGLFSLPGDASQALVASTDGVGTKILIAAELAIYDGVGGDLVNHCVNDILVVGATPLFFLDYLAAGTLDAEIAGTIVAGVGRACRAHSMALLGGETAEMPGMYQGRHFDLAGTIVGIVKTSAVPQPARVRATDAIIGLPSVGLHTNGYSLARALIPPTEWLRPFDAAGSHGTYADALLREHPSYYAAVRAIQGQCDVRAMAHITGGGLVENVPRTLPSNCKAVFEQQRWTVPPIIDELVRRGNVAHDERYRILNMGIGYTLVVPFMDVPKALAAAPGAKVVGSIEHRAGDEPQVVVHAARSA